MNEQLIDALLCDVARLYGKDGIDFEMQLGIVDQRLDKLKQTYKSGDAPSLFLTQDIIEELENISKLIEQAYKECHNVADRVKFFKKQGWASAFIRVVNRTSYLPTHILHKGCFEMDKRYPIITFKFHVDKKYKVNYNPAKVNKQSKFRITSESIEVI